MTTLMQCNEQWMKRPADERFLSLTDLHKATQRQREASVSSVVSTRRMQVIPSPGNELRGLAIEHDNGVISAPTNWAFDQLVGAEMTPLSCSIARPRNSLPVLGITCIRRVETTDETEA
ncbi:MAG: hypothetical protein E6Q97_31935, partial [Desulfurellales bacterium]